MLETTQCWTRARTGAGTWLGWTTNGAGFGELLGGGRSAGCLVARQKTFPSLKNTMSLFLSALRSWLFLVSITTLVSSLQSFQDHTFIYEKLYTVKPDLVNGLQARTFGIWTLLSSVARALCAYDIHNKPLYYLTIWTFLIALGHFLFELFVHETVALTIGIVTPLIVASSSILGMLVGLSYLEVEPAPGQKKRN